MTLAAYCERNDLSTNEMLEYCALVRSAAQTPRAERGISRRDFLKGAAVAAAGLAMPPSLLKFGPTATAPRIVIVGAGIAGLAAAYRLQQAGVPSQVIEANQRVGGRMYTLRNSFPDGQLAELGGELIDSDHESLLGFADELGLTVTDLFAADGDLETELFFFDGRQIPFTEIVETFRPVAAAIISDLATLTGDGDVTYATPNNGEALDISMAAWFDRHEIGSVIRKILDVAYVGEYGLEIEEQSAFNLLWLIETDEGEFSVYGSSDERYHIAEGNDSIPWGLADRLETPVQLETQLEAIRQMSDNRYRLTVNQAGTVTDMDADLVVLAIPFTVLRQVDIQVDLPDVKRRAIDELGYGVNSKLMVAFTERIWQNYGSNGSTFTDLGYQATWDTSRGQPGTAGILTNFLGGRRSLEAGEMLTSAQTREFLAQLDQVFPGAADAYAGEAFRFFWPGNPLALGSFSCYKPGQVVGFRGAEMEPVGGLHFAGEHTSLDYQGYMNGGSESGERVASEILEAIAVR